MQKFKETLKAISRSNWLFVGLSLQRPGLDSRSVYARFVIERQHCVGFVVGKQHCAGFVVEKRTVLGLW